MDASYIGLEAKSRNVDDVWQNDNSVSEAGALAGNHFKQVWKEVDPCWNKCSDDESTNSGSSIEEEASSVEAHTRHSTSNVYQWIDAPLLAARQPALAKFQWIDAPVGLPALGQHAGPTPIKRALADRTAADSDSTTTVHVHGLRKEAKPLPRRPTVSFNPDAAVFIPSSPTGAIHGETLGEPCKPKHVDGHGTASVLSTSDESGRNDPLASVHYPKRAHVGPCSAMSVLSTSVESGIYGQYSKPAHVERCTTTSVLSTSIQSDIARPHGFVEEGKPLAFHPTVSFNPDATVFSPDLLSSAVWREALGESPKPKEGESRGIFPVLSTSVVSGITDTLAFRHHAKLARAGHCTAASVLSTDNTSVDLGTYGQLSKPAHVGRSGTASVLSTSIQSGIVRPPGL